MQNYLLLLLACFAIIASPLGVRAQLVTPANNPDNAQAVPSAQSNLIYFDWQAEWGTIHMNSFVDGLADPGNAASSSGEVPCPMGTFCTSKINTSLDQNGRVPFQKVIGKGKTDKYEGLDVKYEIGHGIKYDIKNSVLNCMSKKVPNWSFKNSSSYTATYVCINNFTMPTPSEDAYSHPDKRSMIHMPLWDSRANDSRSSDDGQLHGCQQQVTNGCSDIRDMHACINDTPAKDKMKPEPKEAYEYPVTHVFTLQEVADLGGTGAQIPVTYYSYDKITAKTHETNKLALPADPKTYINVTQNDVDVYGWGPQSTVNMLKTDCVDVANVKNVSACNSTDANHCDCKIKHWVVTSTETRFSYDRIDSSEHHLSVANPVANAVPGSVKAIDNHRDDALARLKAFRFENNGDGDLASTSIIVDPSDFYDLRLYAAGGKYDAGYAQKTALGLIETPDTCPVLGLTSGYSGICDPTGHAGCNLPIYKVGEQTTFKDANNKSYSFNNYPVIWSGYVKKWSVLSRDKYLENIKDRKAYGGNNLYLQGNEVNNNPVIMLTRANEYCDNRELSSQPVKLNLENPAAPEMECIQYLQYQNIALPAALPNYVYVDMYAPDEDPQPEGHVEFTKLTLYNLDDQGKPSTPVQAASLKGSGEFVGENATSGYISFKDNANPEAVYHDARTNVTVSAIEKTNYDTATYASYDPITKKRKDGKVINTAGDKAPGDYLAIDDLGNADDKKGAGIKAEPGTAMIVSMQEPLKFKYADGKEEKAPCAVIAFGKDVESNVFVPSNSQTEFEAFLKASNSSSGITDGAQK